MTRRNTLYGCDKCACVVWHLTQHNNKQKKNAKRWKALKGNVRSKHSKHWQQWMNIWAWSDAMSLLRRRRHSGTEEHAHENLVCRCQCHRGCVCVLSYKSLSLVLIQRDYLIQIRFLRYQALGVRQHRRPKNRMWKKVCAWNRIDIVHNFVGNITTDKFSILCDALFVHLNWDHFPMPKYNYHY